MDTIFCNVYTTCDYDKFHIMEKGNRYIDHSDKIAKNMEKKFLISVIIVNENYEIIDGQNRFLASKSLGKPIYYIVLPNYGVEETRHYNAEARNWQKKDFIKSYADEGREEYIKFLNFQNMYKDLPATVCESILRFSCGNPCKAHCDNIKSGSFIICDFRRACEVADMIMGYKKFCEHQEHPFYKRKEFVSAIIRLSRCREFDNDLVIRKIKLNPRRFVPCVSSAEYISMIEEIANYRNKNKVRFNI